ncbi:hypothetical protein [Paracoccus sp. (in: a-proteobacteria)]|uniref:hypothetical protein n=1 Tax=Paracoccus sp. TaxID=267 RepID=UPI00396CAF81
MKSLMITAATLALATPVFAQEATTPPATDAMPAETMPVQNDAATGTMPADGMTTTTTETMPADGMTTTETMPAGTMTTDMSDTEVALSATNQGVTASWLEGRSIYTTNQPSSTAWTDVTGDAVPSEWNEIATVSDLVMTQEGELVGYIADIGGFLGLGAHTVLLDRDALHMAQFGDDAVLATNYSQEELEALPEFETDSVRN